MSLPEEEMSAIRRAGVFIEVAHYRTDIGV